MSKKLYEKECELCGALFKTSTSLRKYCDSCRTSVRTKRNQLNTAYKTSYMRVPNESKSKSVKIHNNTCLHCGKEFKSYNAPKLYCTSECEHTYKQEHATCHYCGKNLNELGVIINPVAVVHYCSEDCRVADRAKSHKQSVKKKKICQHCGKEYDSCNARFCSNDCKVAYQKEYGRFMALDKTELSPMQTFTCEYCGKTYQARHEYQGHCCSSTCLTLLTKKTKEQKAKQDLLKAIANQGMCSLCRTSYTSCERMSSNFTLVPKGAKYFSGKILCCPKFKHPKFPNCTDFSSILSSQMRKNA